MPALDLFGNLTKICTPSVDEKKTQPPSPHKRKKSHGCLSNAHGLGVKQIMITYADRYILRALKTPPVHSIHQDKKVKPSPQAQYLLMHDFYAV